MTEQPTVKNCPFCGRVIDITDLDTLYPDGVGWQYDDATGSTSYCDFREVDDAFWCYVLVCNPALGGCGAEMHADTRSQVIERWNCRAGD
jgi:hypothetical protein